MNQIPRDQAERIAKKVFDQREAVFDMALHQAEVEQDNEAYQHEYIRLMADLIQEKE